MAKKPNLNLAAFTGVMAAASGATPPDAEIDVALIVVERQVRSKLGDLTELAAAIKAVGVLEPILLLALEDGRYRLIAGERRLRSSIMAGRTKIPALIKRGLTELQIRQMQVMENNEREDLSAFDEAMGVAEDVGKFGFKEAMAIWNRSEAWISKRLAVTKYEEAVRQVLESGLCGDLEVLHSLNQLYSVSVDEYNGMIERMRSGGTVSRDDARNKVSSAKLWKRQGEQAKKAIEAPRPPAANDGDDQAVEEHEDNEQTPAQKAKKPDSKKTAPPAKGQKAGKAESTPQPVAELSAQQTVVAAAQAQDRAAAGLQTRRAELMEWGAALRPHFNSMQSHMATLGYELAEGEWVLWTGFLDTVLPMLASLGKDRAGAYIKRLQTELKGRDALEWWRALHPAGDGEDNASDDSAREMVPTMPEGWRF